MATSKKKMPDGGKINPKDAAVKKWMQGYVQSPKYKERLSNFYQYPDYVQGQRSKRIEGTQVQEVPGSTLQYSSEDNTLNISPTEIALKALNRQEVVAHELGHAINSNETNPALGLSPKEESFIFNRSNLDPGTKKDITGDAQREEMGISRYMKIRPSLHDFYPTENKSDIDTFRYLLNQQGIYDAGTQDITPEILQKAKQNPVINKSLSTKRLFDNYQDNNLIDVMNKVASNQQSAETTYAADGGKISKYVSPNKNSLKNPSFSNDELSRLYNPDEAVRNWYTDYINSPKYKERLGKSGYNDVNGTIRDRRQRIQNTVITHPDSKGEIGSYYDPGDNMVFIDNKQVKKLSTTRDDILSHELGHAVNYTNEYIRNENDPNKGIITAPANLRLSKDEEKYIGSRNKGVDEGLLLKAQRLASEQGQSVSHILGLLDHNLSPSENKSDVDAFRYILKKEGIYDSGNQDLTPKLLEKARGNKNIKNTYNSQRLLKNFSDKDIIDIMNNIAYNNENNNTTMIAKNGGSLNFSSKPAYNRWIGYIHAKGLAESTPGNQKISINGNSHKVKHAYGGPIDSNIQGYNPYAVSSELQNDTPYLPYKPVGSPLNQASANVNNYFATEQSNMIPNDASLDGPAFDQPEYLLDANTDQVSQSNYEPQSSEKGSSKGLNVAKAIKGSLPRIKFNTAGPILALAGLTGQMAQQKNFNDNQARRINRQFNRETYNPNPYGTGSSAIYKNGGKVSSKESKMANGGYMLGETYNLTPEEINLLSESGYSFDIIS